MKLLKYIHIIYLYYIELKSFICFEEIIYSQSHHILYVALHVFFECGVIMHAFYVSFKVSMAAPVIRIALFIREDVIAVFDLEENSILKYPPESCNCINVSCQK